MNRTGDEITAVIPFWDGRIDALMECVESVRTQGMFDKAPQDDPEPSGGDAELVPRPPSGVALRRGEVLHQHEQQVLGGLQVVRHPARRRTLELPHAGVTCGGTVTCEVIGREGRA